MLYIFWIFLKLICLALNAHFDSAHIPESRPDYAEPCVTIFEDNSAIVWIEHSNYGVCVAGTSEDHGSEIIAQWTFSDGTD